MNKPRPPSDRGQGRKPLSPSGELMRSRPIRMTDEQWEDAKYVGMQAVRDYVTKAAARKRRQSGEL